MTASAFDTAIAALRRAGLTPTQHRLMIAALIFTGPTVALATEELCERAADSGLCLLPAEAEAALAELRAAGALPHVLPPVRRPPTNLKGAVRLLQSMANPVRLRVLRELEAGERSVGELRRAVGLQPSALSQHLARLRLAGIVRTRRDSTRIFYSLAGPEAPLLLRTLGQSGLTAT
jgi:DNA-binding transcriptional ArsR family regulator